jgi:hypothetical protein
VREQVEEQMITVGCHKQGAINDEWKSTKGTSKLTMDERHPCINTTQRMPWSSARNGILLELRKEHVLILRTTMQFSFMVSHSARRRDEESQIKGQLTDWNGVSVLSNGVRCLEEMAIKLGS